MIGVISHNNKYMKFTSAKAEDENKVTITYETEGNGYVVGDRSGIENLAEFLSASDVAITKTRPVNNHPESLYCFDFTNHAVGLNQALGKWPDAEKYKLEYVHPRQPDVT